MEPKQKQAFAGADGRSKQAQRIRPRGAALDFKGTHTGFERGLGGFGFLAVSLYHSTVGRYLSEWSCGALP